MKISNKLTNLLILIFFLNISLIDSLKSLESTKATISGQENTPLSKKKPEFNLSLNKLCTDFQNAELFPERTNQFNSGQQKLPYFNFSHVSNLLDLYCKQVTSNFYSIDFKNLRADQTFFNKMETPKNTKILDMGDFHGSVHSLLRNLYSFYISDFLDDNFILRKDVIIVCNGDYVDRGNFGTEVLIIFLYLKLKNWNQVYLIRGNHEEKFLNLFYGFVSELKQKYTDTAELLHDKFIHIFDTFPSAVWMQIPNGKWILFTHGGFDPLSLTEIKINFLNSQKTYFLFNSERTKYGWYDFKIINNKAYMSDERGLGLKNVTDIEEFLDENDICAIIRGHQHYDPGLKMLTPDTNGIPRDWKKVSNLTIPITLNQKIPIFTLSTATEIPAGPKRSSYAKIIIGETAERCTIEPIETSGTLTNPTNLNKILNQTDSIKTKENENPRSYPFSLYTEETLDDEKLSSSAKN